MTLLRRLGLGERTLVMGVLNVTPDSFSDGGDYADPGAAVARALEMAMQGADIIDIGGESTRPATFHDNAPLDAAEECARVLPVIARLAREMPKLPISVDTYKADVAAAALDAGAMILNDISGLTYDPKMATLAAKSRVPLILMHLPGQPRNIPTSPVYDDVIGDITAFFQRQLVIAYDAGVTLQQIVLDPGIGFGKTVSHNLEILRRLAEFKSLGYPILIGPSRKGFLGKILDGAGPEDRLDGTAAAIAIGIANGADIVRVHDVKEMARVARVADAIVRLSPSERMSSPAAKPQ